MNQEHRWKDRQQITLRDVADAAGVSSSAASVILNGTRSGTRVSTTTRRTVIETAKRLGYRPNAHARSLQTGRSNRICVYVGKGRLVASFPFYAEILEGICEGAAEFGLNTMIHTSGHHESELLALVSNRAVDGLIVHASQQDPILSLLGELRIPAIAVADPIDSLPCVVVDDEAGGILQAQHLASLGHRHILTKWYVGQKTSAEIRMRALTETAGRLGIRVTTGNQSPSYAEGLDADDLRVLMEGADRATAVVGWSDHVAESACNRLESLGIRCPEDVAVIGFDGFQGHCVPKYLLTTIRAPWSAVGRTATSHLAALIAGESVPIRTVLPVEFRRGTTT